MKSLRVLYIGDLWLGSTALQRLAALKELAHCTPLDSTPSQSNAIFRLLYRIGVKLKVYWTFNQLNTRVIREAKNNSFDLIWIDKGLALKKRTVNTLVKLTYNPKVVFYSPDDMSNPSNQSVHYLRSIPLYHLHVTTKSYNVAEVLEKGARDVFFVGNSFDPEVHKPMMLTDEEKVIWGAEVSFIGSWEKERFEYIIFLVENGIRVRVWGEQWARYKHVHANLDVVPHSAWHLDYSKVLNATLINLCFLKKGNRDLQTTRSIEIPACSAFMLAERTNEHQQLFKEDEEAVFFSSKIELLDKVNYYLKNEITRKQIALHGYKRCFSGCYSNIDRIKSVLNHLEFSQFDVPKNENDFSNLHR